MADSGEQVAKPCVRSDHPASTALRLIALQPLNSPYGLKQQRLLSLHFA